MTKIWMQRGKYAGLLACSNQQGVIAAVAIDQRGSLKKMIAKARGAGGDCDPQDLVLFKKAVVKVLTPHASAVLIDPEFGLEGLKEKHPDCGVLLAYEKTGYDAATQGRLPDLLPDWSVRRLIQAGATAIKILIYYNALGDPQVNSVKQAFVERVGSECAALDLPFFLELIAYDDQLDEKSLEFALRKPELVGRYMEEFSKPQYGADILKVEVPVTMKFVEGTRAFCGTAAFSRREAVEQFRQSAKACARPFIYLSAGVTDDTFRESLELAAEAGANFSGVLCGRATWQDGVAAYANLGYQAALEWMDVYGRKNIDALNEVLAQTARPWWDIYGGIENIELVN